MSPQTAEENLAIVRQMIDQTRRHTIQSGHFFVGIGIVAALGTAAIGLMEKAGNMSLTLPIVLLMTLINAVLGYHAGTRQHQGLKTFIQLIFWHIWMISGLTALMAVFLFPNLGLYPLSAVPTIVSLIMGTACYLSGLVLELPLIKLASLAWIGGSVLLALSIGLDQWIIMCLVITLGWIMPGLHLNHLKKQESGQ